MDTFKRLFDESDLDAAIGMFLEYKNDYEYDLDSAKAAGVNEIREGYDASIYIYKNPLEGEDNTSYEPLGHKIQRENEALQDELATVQAALESQSAEIARLRKFIKELASYEEKSSLPLHQVINQAKAFEDFHAEAVAFVVTWDKSEESHE